MKNIILFLFVACYATLAAAQDSINPYTLHQKCNIVLQDSDVYYCPFHPPGPMDTRQNLCNESDIYNDPNGVGNGNYSPRVYADTGFVPLASWAPCGTPIGPYTTWQRLFQAMNKPDGTPSDITAGGGAPGTRVTISKNEDVDFRATGRIKLKSGFHVKGGAFFHAYTEPKWDTAVFSDEFDSAAKFNNQWAVWNGNSRTPGWSTAQCLYDSNVYLDTDYQAHDGHALDIVFRVNPGTCSCDSVYESDSACEDPVGISSLTSLPTIWQSKTESGYMRSCPFPFNSISPASGEAYAHAPYGKYEMRDKIPDMYHHTNNWGGGPGEWDLDERDNDCMGISHPNWGHAFVFGPCHGYFKRVWNWKYPPLDSVWGFISHDDTAWYSKYQPTGLPDNLIIDNFNYGVNTFTRDTFFTVTNSPPFPASWDTSSATFTFYYERYSSLPSDVETWTVIKGSDGKWDMFSAPYDTAGGVPHLFTKDYQPHALTLTKSYDSLTGKTTQTTYGCHWVDTANEPNHGKIYLDNPIPDTSIHSWTEQFRYQLIDNYSGLAYPIPTVLVGPDTANNVDGIDADPSADSVAFETQPYQYHTYAMEYLPHEVRILYDSVVVRRIPDRLIPRSSPYFDWVGTAGRIGLNILPAEFDADDTVSAPSGDAIHELNYFLSHTTNPGFWDVNGQPAAHHMLDYVKVWDVPKDVKIPAFPQ